MRVTLSALLKIFVWLDIGSLFFQLLSMIKIGWEQKQAGFLDEAIFYLFHTSWTFQLIVIVLLLAGLLIIQANQKSASFFSSEVLLRVGRNVTKFLGWGLIFFALVPLLLFIHSEETIFRIGSPLLFCLVFSYLFSLSGTLILNYFLKKSFHQDVKKLAKQHALVVGLFCTFILLSVFFEVKKQDPTELSLAAHMMFHAKNLFILLSPLFFMLFLLYRMCQLVNNKVLVIEAETSNSFGSARFVKDEEIKRAGFYEGHHAILSGQDENGRSLYLPLLNKLTLSPQGGGKTSCSSVNVLLSHPGNCFVFDIKGELWAVTSRFRREAFNKAVVALDPYGLTRSPDFAKGKDKALLNDYTLNPFDWIPEDPKLRDRMINAFAASFIINEGGSSQHFDENAKILIRGLIDYMMRALPKAARNLKTLYALLSEHQDQANETFQHMATLSGRAAAAANQISRVGVDERGSILSTSYRQIDWMSDTNINALLAKSNVDLNKFMTGQMDIYVILPEDQIKEHQRFVRMLLSLLTSLIVQTPPSKLPKEKMLFLLDELAQLGYCPDVEQAIEVLRARKLVVWTVFQTLSQIKLYKKPDLFMGAPIKQIFTNDDVETLQWIQALGGKKTIMTKTLSSNEGDSKQKMQWVGGTVSSGEGESYQETGVDLIPLNEIRELNSEEQFIFMHGLPPIKCKKVRYYQHDYFKGKFDVNPIESS